MGTVGLFTLAALVYLAYSRKLEFLTEKPLNHPGYAAICKAPVTAPTKQLDFDPEKPVIFFITPTFTRREQERRC